MNVCSLICLSLHCFTKNSLNPTSLLNVSIGGSMLGASMKIIGCLTTEVLAPCTSHYLDFAILGICLMVAGVLVTLD